MEKEGREEQDLGELTVEELERQEGLELPDREALSVIVPHLPGDPGILPVTPNAPDPENPAPPEITHEPEGA